MANTLEKIVDKTLDIFFQKDKTKLYVLILFIMGFILRLTNVINSGTSVDASGHALMAFDFISSGKLGTWNQSVGLWHFLTDIAYKLFGVGDFGARFVALLFGSFSIILIFLFVKEIFNKKTGLIAAFLLAFSPFHITETIPEMDVAVMFFVLFGMLFFVKALKQDKRIMFVLSGMFIGTGILIKIYALLFVPALVIYSLYHIKKKDIVKKKVIKNIFIFLVVVFIFCIVPLTYNYLLYKDKGFMDHIFTNTLGFGKEKSDKYYSWVVPYKHDYLAFFIGSYGEIKEIPFFVYYLKTIFNLDVIMILLGLIGLFLLAKKPEKDYLILLICVFFTVYLYLGSIPYFMTKHYIFLLILLTPLAALTLSKLTNIFKKINPIIFILPIIIFQLFWVGSFIHGDFYSKSPMNKLVDYKKDIGENSLVVFDSRIFRGIGTYIFMDKHYLESSFFSQLISMQDQIQESPLPTEVYFIECAKDDCGWGTIKDQPEFNENMERIVDFFKNNSKIDKKIYDKNKNEEFIIYKSVFQLKPSSLQIADSTHMFWSNPVGYNENISPVFDSYDTYTLTDKIIDKIAHLIFYFSAVFSILSIFILLYLFIQENDALNNNSSL